MNEISGIGPSQGPGEIARKAGRGTPVPPKDAAKSDSVEISSKVEFKAALGRVSEVRTDRVESIRAQIRAGDYLTDDKINAAIDGLLKDLF